MASPSQDRDRRGRQAARRLLHRADRTEQLDALRILPSSHTNPVWVTVDKKPVRASRRSAQWLREAVDVCFRQKVGRVRLHEQGEMIRAYDHARKTYDGLIAESTVE